MEVKAYENQFDFVKSISIPTDEIFDFSGFRVRWAGPLSHLPLPPKAIAMAIKDGASQQQQTAQAQLPRLDVRAEVRAYFSNISPPHFC